MRNCATTVKNCLPPARTVSPMHLIAVAVIVLIGTAVSVAIFAFDRAAERARFRTELERQTQERVELLRSKIAGSTEVLHSIATFFGVRNNNVSRTEFTQFVRDALARQPELLALSWTPRVSIAEKSQFENGARQDGLGGFQFLEEAGVNRYMPVQLRAEYFPVYYIAPMQHNAVALGFDLHSNPIRAHTLDQSRDTGTALATPPISLVQELNGPHGFIVYLPIYRNGPLKTIADRRNALTGYTAAVYRITDLVDSSFHGLGNDFDARIEDRTDAPDSIFHRPAAEACGAPLAEYAAEASLDLAGRHWTVILRPTPQSLAARMTSRPWVVLSIGLAMTLMLTAYLSNILRQRAEIKRQVHERTQALRLEIAERRRAEAQAVLAERKYRNIFENCIEGIFQTTPDGHYLSVNPALTRVYGYDCPDELIRDLSNIETQLYVDPQRRAQFVRDAQRNGVVTNFESQVYRRDGTIIWISENARAVRDDHGKLMYYEGTVEDITERKAAETRLRQAHDDLEERVRQRTAELARSNEALKIEVTVRQDAEARAAAANRAKSTFLANISHEIRTPMNAIVGYAQILRRDPDLRLHQREAVDTIVAGGDHLLELIGDLLDLSKIEAGRTELRPVAFELGALLKDVSSFFGHRCQEKGIRLLARLAAPGPIHVRGDEGKLRQVLINLLGNAVKHTDSGQVSLRVDCPDKNIYRFEVNDTGSGIPPELLQTIFQPFEQGDQGARRGGTGLGLTIAQRHVALMGGELCVASTVGVGSTFYFSVGLESAVPELNGDKSDVAPAQSTAGENPTIAAVELPSALVERMLRSAEIGGVTEIKTCTHELEQLGPNQAKLAARIWPYLRRFDIEGVVTLLLSDSVRTTQASEVDATQI